ncbi:MAG: hypothetical protein ACJAY5_001650, partial [Actinomycetes bacterium]
SPLQEDRDTEVTQAVNRKRANLHTAPLSVGGE